MRAHVGVVSRFNAWTEQEHPFRKPLAQAGLEYVPIRLGSVELTTAAGAGPGLRRWGGLSAGPALADLPGLDAVLWRVSENLYPQCRGLIDFLAAECQLINSAECMRLCSDKWATHVRLNSLGIPTVATHLLLPDNCIPDLGTPRTVVKPSFGAGGRGIRALSPGSAFAAEEPYIAQPEISSDPSLHIRVLVCAGEPLVAIHRTPGSQAPNRLSINNLDAGGISQSATLGPVAEIATAAAGAVDGFLVGVDLVPDENDGYTVLEINSSPGLEGANKHSPENVYTAAAQAIGRLLEDATPATK